MPVDLPKTSAQPLNQDSEPLTVSINAEGKIFLQDQEVQLRRPGRASCRRSRRTMPDRRIFVRGDKDLAYGRIMEVMGTITQGGFTKVALLAEQPLRAPAAGVRIRAAPPRRAARPPAPPTPARAPPRQRRAGARLSPLRCAPG